jgi:hypothetical protein
MQHYLTLLSVTQRVIVSRLTPKSFFIKVLGAINRKVSPRRYFWLLTPAEYKIEPELPSSRSPG